MKSKKRAPTLVHGSESLRLHAMLQTNLLKDFSRHRSLKLCLFSTRQHGKKIMTIDINLVCEFCASIDIEAIKLHPEFLQNCDILEKQFKDLLFFNSIKLQFEDFLLVNFNLVKHISERQFHQYIIKQSLDGPYGDFVRYGLFNDYLTCRLCQILAVLLATSVDCERGFSILNCIKTNLRNKLSGIQLGSLMRITSMIMSVGEFKSHSEELIRRWRNKRLRRDSNKADSMIVDSDRPRRVWCCWQP